MLEYGHSLRPLNPEIGSSLASRRITDSAQLMIRSGGGGGVNCMTDRRKLE